MAFKPADINADEFKQAVAAIVAYTRSRDFDVPAAVVTAAEVFARDCQSINERLVTCDELLKANQRSEAVRQVGLEPDLLELYRVADDPKLDRDHWADTAAKLGLPVPPALMRGAANRLHKAFDAEAKITPLLRDYRFLALARAPLRQRLTVVRQLAEQEPGNFSWGADARAYEASRFEEMWEALNDPDQANDMNVVRRLHDELRGKWAAPPPLPLVAAVQKQYTTLLRALGEAEFARLAPPLEQALRGPTDREAVTRVEDLTAQVRGSAERYDLLKNRKVADLLSRADEWIEGVGSDLKREEKFMHAVEVLGAALDANIDAEYIRQCYWDVLSYEEFVVPAPVAARYAAWVRKGRLVVWGWVAAAVVAVLIGVLIFVLVRK